MLQPPLLILLGLGLLGVGGELLVRGASRLAALFGVPPLVVGLTVVAFGTSTPELAVSVRAVGAGAGDLALGNVLGSNVFNILVILGLSALVAPMVITRRVIWVEVPIVIGISVLAFVLASDRSLGMADGLLLLAVVVVYVGWLLRTARSPIPHGEMAERPTGSAVGALAGVVAGIGLLVAGANWLVDGAATLALAAGISEAVVGLTIVSVGTSLPEVTAAVVAALRGHGDIAVGNALGSNVFNLTLILGTASVLSSGLDVPPGLLTFDFVVVLAVTIACLPIFYTGHRIARWEGGLFVAYYVVYLAFLVLEASGHQALPRIRHAMLFFALPITVVTLAVLVWQQRRAAVAP